MTTVLIADDESGLRRLVSATLASDEYEIVQASNGDDAWALIQAHRPEVAILDVQMPGRSGLELAQAIKADPALAGMRVIMLTAKAREADIRMGLGVGADVYLTKPFSPMQLISTVEQALKMA